jgi:peptidyl-prolyl cis-trans isomerase B (cyclophilin B)
MLLLVIIGLPATLVAAKSPAQQQGIAGGGASVAPAEPTAKQVAAAKKQGSVRVKLVTTRGDIQVELDGSAAPIAVANFLNLVKCGFYNGMPFHRVVPGFVVQAGDPALVNRPAVGYTIRDERSPIKHLRGTIAMARLYRGGQMVPNSASTQFYITLSATPHLDQLGFTAFGKVVAGMDVADKITVGDKIREAAVVAKAGHPAAVKAP